MMTAKISFKSIQKQKKKEKNERTCKCMSYYRRIYIDTFGVRRCDECNKPIYGLDI